MGQGGTLQNLSPAPAYGKCSVVAWFLPVQLYRIGPSRRCPVNSAGGVLGVHSVSTAPGQLPVPSGAVSSLCLLTVWMSR